MNRLCLFLAILGIMAVASLGLAPLETLIPANAGISVPRFALLIQPMILVLATTALGCWAAPKVGLGAPVLAGILSNEPLRANLRLTIAPAVAGGVVCAGILIAYGSLTSAAFATAENPNVARLMAFQVPLLSKLLYGGMAEEIMARWGVMSAVALAGLKFGLKRTAALLTGLIVAALLFGLGHLPLLFAVMPSPPAWLIGAVIIGNVGPGLIFGMLFWHRGLEAAMLAHASAHLLATLATT